MKFNKEALIARLKEKTTLAAIAGVIVVSFALPPGSENTIAGLAGILLAAIWPESE